jgi:hypothetical protein
MVLEILLNLSILLIPMFCQTVLETQIFVVDHVTETSTQPYIVMWVETWIFPCFFIFHRT